MTMTRTMAMTRATLTRMAINPTGSLGAKARLQILHQQQLVIHTMLNMPCVELTCQDAVPDMWWKQVEKDSVRVRLQILHQQQLVTNIMLNMPCAELTCQDAVPDRWRKSQ